MTEAGQNPMQCMSPPLPLAGLARTQSVPSGSGEQAISMHICVSRVLLLP